MEKKITLFHGSEKKHNDFGLGFYCTENEALAKEWAVSSLRDGFANRYTLDTEYLRVLHLNSPDYTILNWIAVLVEHRLFSIKTPVNDSSDLILGSAIKCYNSAVQQELYAFFSGNAAWDQTAADQSEKVGYTTGAVALAGPHWRFAELSQHDYERLYTQLRNSDLKVDAYADMNTLPDTPNVTVEEQN